MTPPDLTVKDSHSGLRVENLRKSYRKRVVIRDFSMELNRGEVVALLGPNGSGKSNIADAICFVLGRLSIKSMRAAKSANLIFAGTKAVKPASEASVKIIFNNSDKGLPINTKHVEIQRIVRKNGQSIYKINSMTKTRNEVIELLVQAGIDPYGFNIVLQGEIIDVIKMNSENRRKVIEEVSGISVYEARKKRSLRELERTEEKLKEISAILRERTAYLRNLENERQQALRFKKLEQNLKRYKASIFSRQIDEKNKEIKKIDSEIEKNNKIKEKLKEKIKRVQEEIHGKDGEINNINTYTQKSSGVEMERLHDEVADLRAGIAGLDVRKENLSSRIDEVIRRRSRAQEEVKDYEKEISELKKKSPLMDKKLKELEVKKKELSLIEERRKKFYSLRTELNSLKEILRGKEKQLQKVIGESDFLLKEIEKLSGNLINKDIDSCRKRIKDIVKSIEKIDSDLKEAKNQGLQLEKSIFSYENEIKNNNEIKKQVSKLDLCPLCKTKITKEHIEEVYDECNNKISKYSKKLESDKNQLEKVKKKILDLSKNLESNKNQLEKNKIELIRFENISEKNNYLKRLVSDENEIKNEINALELRRKKLETNIKDVDSVEDKYNKMLFEIEDISSRSEDNIDAELKFKQRDLEQTKNIIKHSFRDEEDLTDENEEVEEKLESKIIELRKKEKQEQELQKKFQKLFAKREILQKEVQDKNSHMINLNHELRGFEDKVNNMKIDNAKVNAELENLQVELKEFEGVEVVSMSVAHLREKIDKTQQILNNIGNVNLRALEVYDTIKEEYDAVAKKSEILLEEKAEILKIIQEIDKKKKRTFMKTLDAVNQIFSRNFLQLSTKGQAFLDLENKTDPFAGGLNIVIRVARGKYFDVSSLSGGEKTLIALSLIFAIQEYKPYCFYIFDEVDAALDKRNSEKLANLIKKYMKTGQYIVVTHNDALITESTVLYGVSMQEGLSKILTMEL